MVRMKQTTNNKNKLKNIKFVDKKLVTKKQSLNKHLVKKGFNREVSDSSLNVAIEPVTNEDLKKYIDFQSNHYKPDLTLNSFISKLRKCKEHWIIIADLSNLNIGKSRSKQLFDLRNANFIGSILNNTKFINCDLEGAKFCGIHLENVLFQDSNLSYVDFRDADLSSCEFSDSYRDSAWSSQVGLKFSSTPSCIRIFADIKNNLAKKNEQQRLLHNKKLEFYEIRSNTPLTSRIALFFHLTDACHEYRRVRSEYIKMQKGIFYTEHMIHTSFQNIFHPESFVFEPVMLKDEDFYSYYNKKLVPLNRRDIIEFLNKHKKSKNLSLNDFAKEIYIKSLPNDVSVDKDIKIIADVSSRVNVYGNNEWNRINLSGLDFSDIDISEANFAGTNLSKCIFKNTNISYSNFESAFLDSAIFDKTIAYSSRFYNANLSNSSFKNCDFKKARFDWAVLNSSTFENVNFDFIKAVSSSWRKVSLNKCSINNANFCDVDFRLSNYSKVVARHTIFNKSNFNKSHFADCCFGNSLFNLIKSLHTIWDNTKAESIEARHSNFTGCKISEKCHFENSDFSYSILDGIKAPRANFTNSIMDYIKICYGKFAEGEFDNVSMRFSELDSCVFSESKCKKLDLTGGKMFNVRMIKSDLHDSIWNGSEIRDSDFSNANFSSANWKNTNIKDTILEGINNHRVRINDNTEIIDCQFKDLSGQFYHYDEDNFMDIMFIEQLKLNMQNIQNSERLIKWGVFGFVLKMLNSEYRIPSKEIRRLHNYRMRNKKELRKCLRQLKFEEHHGINIHQFMGINSILSQES